MSLDNARLLAQASARNQYRQLFYRYSQVFDPKKPPGPDNIGAYPWQVEFHNAGANHPERLLMAANRIGKCITINTYIDTPTGPRQLKDLLGSPFKVLALGRGGKVEAWAKTPFKKKGLHQCYRVWAADGRWFECADDHRIFYHGSWRFVSDLLASWPILQASSLELGQAVRAGDARRWSETQQDSPGGYPRGCRFCDGPPPSGSDTGQVHVPLQGDAQERSGPWCDSDDPGNRCTSIGPLFSGLPSILDGLRRAWGQYAAFSNRVFLRFVLPKSLIHQESSRFSFVGVSGFPEAPAGRIPKQVASRAGSGPSSDSLMDENRIVAYMPIGLQEVYDFEVPVFHNYYAAGILHHNTQAGAAECAIHATGEYPPWWKGKRFKTPVKIWTGAERTEDSKEVVQIALLGAEGNHGSGWIPKSRIADVKYRQAGVSDVVDQVYVRHKTGGMSFISLKTYQQEARGWRGARCHVVWLDEECKTDIYTEAQTRVLDERGIVLMTFTPLLGPSDVVRHFMEAKPGSGIYIKNVTWDEAYHLDKEEKERLWASYPEWERDARSKGVPMLGTGAIFPISDEAISCVPQEFPSYFKFINGIDFGIDHPGAGAFCAFDADKDIFYVYDAYKKAGETPVYHAHAMKKHGEWIPTAWPHDGIQQDKGSGIPLKNQYKQHGLRMLAEHAQYPQGHEAAGKNITEPALIEMLEYMRVGRFKVFSTLHPWFEEKRLYHRKDGKIVRKYDDLISATRYAFMMRRYAISKPPTIIPVRKFKGPIIGGRKFG